MAIDSTGAGTWLLDPWSVLGLVDKEAHAGNRAGAGSFGLPRFPGIGAGEA
jgi:hypothetical protein